MTTASRIILIRMRRSICLAAALIVAGCGSRPSPTSPTEGSSLPPTFAFTRSPIDVAAIEYVTPLGNLNPPGHTLPTDHIYFYRHLFHRTAPAFDVIAPADGDVAAILRGGDDAIYVRASSRHMYYLGHVVLDAGIAQGQHITAGQRLGTTSSLSFGLDLGLIDNGVTQGFLAPARYSDNSLHAAAPLPFFTESLRAELYALVNTHGDRDGRINYDVAGTLSGNWFHESLSAAESAGPSGWSRHLAFVRDPVDNDQVRVAIGGVIAPAGVYAIAPGDPDPAGVTVSGGTVAFHLTSTQFGGPSGTMTVTWIDAARIRLTFDGNAHSYVR
jgi:hypothetical protein